MNRLARVGGALKRARVGLVGLCGIALFIGASASPLAPGERAPSCTAASLDGARSLSLADYQGQVVYLDFWASWCGPCRESFPFMNQLQREFGGRGLAILAISVDKSGEDARHFLERFPAEFTIALDSGGVCPAAYQLQGMPSSYLIGRDGRLRAAHVGFRESDKADIRQQLLAALRESR